MSGAETTSSDAPPAQATPAADKPVAAIPQPAANDVGAATGGSSAGSPRPEGLYIVADGQGFIGAFYSAESARAAMRPYPLIPYVVQRWAVAPGELGTVWVVLASPTDAVLYASNSRARAEQAYASYSAVGMTYPDSLDYWQRTPGRVHPAVAPRLEAIARAHTMYAGPAAAEELERMEAADRARVEALLARADGGEGPPPADGGGALAVDSFNILDGVVEVEQGMAPPQSSGAATASPDAGPPPSGAVEAAPPSPYSSQQ